MSSLVYGAITRTREAAPPGDSTKAAPPGLATFVDALAGLVPAEVLAAHAVILSQLTTTTKTAQGQTTITDTAGLTLAFWLLLVTSAVLFVVGHRLPHTVDTEPQAARLVARWWRRVKEYRWNWVRLLIPPAAFVGWTLLQRPSSVDAVWGNLGDGRRFVIAIVGAVLVGAIATVLGQQANDQPPPSPVSGSNPVGVPSSASTTPQPIT